MQHITELLSALVLILAFGHERWTAVALHQGTTTATKPKCPQFMENLYKSVLKGRRHLFNVIHSNTAVDVRRTNGSFEAIFNDLGFSRKEILKRARLRLNVSREKHCSSKYTLRVIDGESLQIVDEYIRVMKYNGINSIPLTKSLKKWVLGSSGNKSLQVKIIFDSLSRNESSCHKAVSAVSKEAYLITQTKPKDKPIARRSRWKRSAKNVSSQSTSKSCAIQKLDVDLTGGSIILPQWFSTGLCGAWRRAWPRTVIPIIKEVLKAIKSTIKRTRPAHNNLTCCVPTAYKKLLVLYTNSNSHFTLAPLDKIVVTRCGCSSKT